ncbi:MAG: c-type cytochrome [Gemmatimonadaceae bacterium]
MSERVPAAIAVVSSIVILVYACTTATTTTNPSPSPSPQEPVASSGGQPVASQAGPPGQRGNGGPRVPLTDSARRVRDSLNTARRDSGAAMALRSIAGHENEPAESVFKNIKIFKGVPAARLVNIMNMGFGRSLGVSCGFCHVPGKWDLDDKDEKNIARLMFAMVQTVNRDYLSKVPNDRGSPPVASCFTCHRGSPRPASQEGPPRPVATPGENPQ